MSTTVLDGLVCQIRNIQISSQDLLPPLLNQKQKLPSTTINTFGAYLQATMDADESYINKPAIFSLWLGPLASGEIKDGNKAAAKEALKKMKLKIPGGKMPKEAQKK